MADFYERLYEEAGRRQARDTADIFYVFSPALLSIV